MKRTRTLCILSVIFNLANAILVACAVGSFFFSGGSGNMDDARFGCFRYFTIDSNVLAALTSIILIPCLIRAARGKSVPAWADRLKFVGTTAAAVTFVTVVLFLGPTQGYVQMFSGAAFPLHLVCPLLSVISFCFFDSPRRVTFGETLLGVIPTAVYGALYFVMVIVIGEANGGWIDFYGFDRSGMRYVSIAAMLIGTWAIALVLRALRNIPAKKMN